MTLTIPISRFRRLLFAVLQAIAPARASAAAHAQLSQLYDRWGTAVFRAAYAYLHNKSDAEDVLQDTFLQYMRTSPELESPAHEKGVAAAGCHQPEQKQAEFGVVQAHGHTRGKLSVR